MSIEHPDPPAELVAAIAEFWPEEERGNAADIAWLESAYDSFAVHDSTSPAAPCGTIISASNGVSVAAERSIGYFQLNACNFEGWEWQRFYNARHNAGTAHMLWAERGWQPWYFSAKLLGLI